MTASLYQRCDIPGGVPTRCHPHAAPRRLRLVRSGDLIPRFVSAGDPAGFTGANPAGPLLFMLSRSRLARIATHVPAFAMRMHPPGSPVGLCNAIWAR